MSPLPPTWAGAWVGQRLGVSIAADRNTSDTSVIADLAGLAVRRNPRRAHLVVSRVLGKHIPVSPTDAIAAGRRLGQLAVARIAAFADSSHSPGSPQRLPNDQVLVLGFAETATALGHLVADACDNALYLHTTRRRVAGLDPIETLEEVHSHAREHLLLPADPGCLATSAPVIVVDDELTTGRTAIATIRALHAFHPHRGYVIAALLDLRSDTHRADLAALADDLGVPVDVVALVTDELTTPSDVLDRGKALVAALDGTDPPFGDEPSVVRRLVPAWPVGLPLGGRHGFTAAHRAPFAQAMAAVATVVAQGIPAEGRLLVLGTEELMYAPMMLAERLAAERSGSVWFSSTTRSPVLPVNEEGYAVRTRLSFASHDGADQGAGSPRFAYNVAPCRPEERFDQVVVVVDEVADTGALWSDTGLIESLRRVCGGVSVVVLPEDIPVTTTASSETTPAPLVGPLFSSYSSDEVAWLLTDLSDARLEAPRAEREAAIQAGTAHYSESLPIEYEPTDEYLRLFQEALVASADRVAQAVGVVAERVLAGRPAPVLVSLARAGTPIGILMRRWVSFAHGVDLPHYTISIIRGKGIDRVALRHLAEAHDPEQVVFIDGWTGKGAICRELATAVAAVEAEGGPVFDPTLAVLADPGRCAKVFGTRDDFLIPSACLNSTVSGLVSRTVLNAALIGPGQYHGAKFYRHLAPVDLSKSFLDTITGRFAAVAGAVSAGGPYATVVDPDPDWAGWRSASDLCDRYGLNDINLVKPGVGETTRVLLRRVPWRVLIRPDARPDLGHVLLLAQDRNVPVDEIDDLPYSCVGLIRPTRAEAVARTVGGVTPC